MKEALLVIDVQNEYFTGKLPVTFPENSFENILAAMDHARAVKMPVVVIQHTNPAPDSATFRKSTDSWELHDAIQSRHADTIIEKKSSRQFYRNLSRFMVTGECDFYRNDCRLHDPDVLRYHRPAGIPSWLYGKLPVRCYRYIVNYQRCRQDQ